MQRLAISTLFFMLVFPIIKAKPNIEWQKSLGGTLEDNCLVIMVHIE
jgi:hypothetical protein